jgi:hypothetical protein
MILNSESVELIRLNAHRLVNAITSKDDLIDLATASSFEQFFSAIETILTNTDMYFDDDFLARLELQSWQSFKAILLVYALNVMNKKANLAREGHFSSHPGRDFGATHTNI